MNVFVFVIESGYDVSPLCRGKRTPFPPPRTGKQITPVSFSLDPPQAALTAVYGKDDELQVFIDHHRLRSILTAAQANDPSGKGAALVRRCRFCISGSCGQTGLSSCRVFWLALYPAVPRDFAPVQSCSGPHPPPRLPNTAGRGRSRRAQQRLSHAICRRPQFVASAVAVCHLLLPTRIIPSALFLTCISNHQYLSSSVLQTSPAAATVAWGELHLLRCNIAVVRPPEEGHDRRSTRVRRRAQRHAAPGLGHSALPRRDPVARVCREPEALEPEPVDDGAASGAERWGAHGALPTAGSRCGRHSRADAIAAQASAPWRGEGTVVWGGGGETKGSLC